MSYEIIIKQKRTITKMVGPEWVQVGTDEVERNSRYLTDSKEPKTRIEPRFGYAPDKIERQVEVDEEVLHQRVDDLDLKLVVKAINGLF